MIDRLWFAARFFGIASVAILLAWWVEYGGVTHCLSAEKLSAYWSVGHSAICGYNGPLARVMSRDGMVRDVWPSDVTTAIGSSVMVVYDQTGHGHNVYQSSEENRPTLERGDISGTEEVVLSFSRRSSVAIPSGPQWLFRDNH